MPANLHHSYEVNTTRIEREMMTLARPGDDPVSRQVPRFMRREEQALRIPENDSLKPRPAGLLREDLILESSLKSPFIAEIIKKTCIASLKKSAKMFMDQV